GGGVRHDRLDLVRRASPVGRRAVRDRGGVGLRGPSAGVDSRRGRRVLNTSARHQHGGGEHTREAETHVRSVPRHNQRTIRMIRTAPYAYFVQLAFVNDGHQLLIAGRIPSVSRTVGPVVYIALIVVPMGAVACGEAPAAAPPDAAGSDAPPDAAPPAPPPFTLVALDQV